LLTIYKSIAKTYDLPLAGCVNHHFEVWSYANGFTARPNIIRSVTIDKIKSPKVRALVVFPK